MSELIRTREWVSNPPNWRLVDKEYTYKQIVEEGGYSEDSVDLVPQLVRRCQELEAEIDRLRAAYHALHEPASTEDPPRCQFCGYTEDDARTLMDHRYCREGYGHAPWSESIGECAEEEE